MASSRIARACMLAVAVLFSALTMGASVPYSIDCSVASGFIPVPNENKRLGYITAFKGLGLLGTGFSADLIVTPPNQGDVPPFLRRPARNTAAVVGIVESLKWAGGPGDPIEINFYVSQDNAFLLKSTLQSALKSTIIDQLGWWIFDFDQEVKQWYLAAYPAPPNTVSATFANKTNPDLNVNLVPVTVSGVNLYRISLKLIPPANSQQNLAFASSAKLRAVKPWGMKIGGLSSYGG